MEQDNGVRLVFRPDPKDVPEIMRRTRLTLGQPFLTIPMETRPTKHQVLMVIDGHKVRRDEVEMVFNDTVDMNFVYALAGHQSGDDDPPDSPMAQVRALARRLYGSYGEWVEANYGVLCMECHYTLPAHSDVCEAGKRHETESRKLTEPEKMKVMGQGYYKLRCETCQVDFFPVLATSREELLNPDYDQCRETAGAMNAESLERFHSAHRGHALEAVADESD